jgi:hypothetical protein
VVDLGGNVKQISATVGGAVFAIGSDNIVYENWGGGWHPLGGSAQQISAGLGNTVYAVGSDNAVYENPG